MLEATWLLETVSASEPGCRQEYVDVCRGHSSRYLITRPFEVPETVAASEPGYRVEHVVCQGYPRST